MLAERRRLTPSGLMITMQFSRDMACNRRERMKDKEKRQSEEKQPIEDRLVEQNEKMPVLAVQQLIPHARVHAHMDFERTLIASFEHHYNSYVPVDDLHEAFNSIMLQCARSADGTDKFESGAGEERFMDYFLKVS
uniref:Uncharacterized protein n=1 Tax=Ditylenchus dipsaci TaxID=166011 RepID=A0A915ELT3_9BILA